jgi:predicted phosphodiesterase
MAGMGMKWLHLSDWHQKGKDFDRGLVRDALLRDLRKRTTLNEQLAEIDFVVFSGDLAHGGKETEYETAAKEFLDPVLEELKVPKERLLIVPGNHDVDRSRLAALPPLLKTLRSREKVVTWLTDPHFRDTLLSPLSAYKQFCKKYLNLNQDENAAYGWSRKLSINGRSAVIVGLNSSWMCGQNKKGSEVNDFGFLILGEPQVEQVLNTPEFQKADVKIAVLHHPFWWMSSVEHRTRTERRLARECHFILRGHEHDPEVSVPMGTSGNYAVISAGAAYDRRDLPNGYNFVYLDFEQRQSTVYLRRYEDARLEFTRDTSVTGEDTPGYSTFTLPGELGRSPLKASSQRSEGTQRSLTGDLWAVQNPSTMSALGEIFMAQHAHTRFEYLKTAFVVQAHSLLQPGEPGYGNPDSIRALKTFRPAGTPIYCYQANLAVADDDQFLGRVLWDVQDQNGVPIRTVAVPIRTKDRRGLRELRLSFDPVLQPGTGPYSLMCEWWVNNSMKPLQENGVDELFLDPLRAEGLVGSIDLVLQFPSSFEAPLMVPDPNGNSDGGRPMTSEELNKYKTPEGFTAIGWTGENLPKDRPFTIGLKRPPQN